MKRGSLFQIQINGMDEEAIIAKVTNSLFDLGANLEDSYFNVLNGKFDFGLIVAFGLETVADDILSALKLIKFETGKEISVKPYDLEFSDIEEGKDQVVSLLVTGGDRPGLVLRISEILASYHANIIRMTSQPVPVKDSSGRQSMDYCTRFYFTVLPERLNAVKATILNTAGSMRLNCEFS